MPLVILLNKRQETAAGEAAVFVYCVNEKMNVKGMNLLFLKMRDEGFANSCLSRRNLKEKWRKF